jgi:hypothetical protein
MVSTASHILENSVADDTAADSRTAGRSSAVHKAWAEETSRSEALAGKVQVWDPESFAQQQILHLVQRVFFQDGLALRNRSCSLQSTDTPMPAQRAVESA